MTSPWAMTSTDDKADVSRYDLRKLPLCPACAAPAKAHTYKREPPPAAARALRRGAA